MVVGWGGDGSFRGQVGWVWLGQGTAHPDPPHTCREPLRPNPILGVPRIPTPNCIVRARGPLLSTRSHPALDPLSTQPSNVPLGGQGACWGEAWACCGAPAKKASRGFEARALDSESRVLAVTPQGRLHTASGV